MKKLIAVFALVLGLASIAPAQTPQGPFGFERGMSPEQVIKLVGQPFHVEDDEMFFSMAPKPNDEFEDYLLTFSPTEGLLAVVAFGRDIQTGDDGDELQTAYHNTILGVESKYGPPDTDEPSTVCSGDDTECSNSQFWMMSLLDKNRVADSFWGLHQTGPYPNKVSTIVVSVMATDIHTGFIICGFSFAGYDAYNDSKKAKQNSTF